jgi:amino acid adenylation domain-containing protein
MTVENKETIEALSLRQRAALEALLRKKRSKSAEKDKILPRTTFFEYLPLSFSQQRLWFLNQLEPDSTAYVIPFAARMQGELDVQSFEQSLNEIYRRHDILRTTFKETDRGPQQVISAPADTRLPLVNLQPLPHEKREAAVQRLILAEARDPFDLSRGPLLRAKLLRLGEQEHVFVLTMHHIISDGWSWGIILKELASHYQAFHSKRGPALPDLPIQYADYAIWQRQWMQGAVLEKQLAYWKKQLGGELPVLQLPKDRLRPAVQTYKGAETVFALSANLKRDLEELSRNQGVTLFMTLLAAFSVLLYRYSGQEDIAIGSPIANRNRSEIENLIGFFANTLVFRNDLAGNPSFKDLLARVREVTLGAYDHQDLPFEKLVEELRPARDLSYSPLFQVMFVWQSSSARDAKLPNLIMTPMRIDTGTSMFDLTLILREETGGLSGKLEYSTELFNAETIRRLGDNFKILLESIVADSTRHIAELELLTEAERRRLLVDWNKTDMAYPRSRCVHELFEDQVERTPDSIAVVYESHQLTYRELNLKANRLAHHLQQQGVGPDTVVGIYVERSIELIVAVLAVLKAGAAYLPLDATYPLERLTFILSDARVRWLLTQKRLLKRTPATDAKVIVIDGDSEAGSGENDKNPHQDVRPDNLAYVIYTSGSTGKPKGTLIEHRGVTNLNHYLTGFFGIEPDSRVLQFAAFGFDASVTEIFPTFTVGATLYLASQKKLSSGEDLIRLLRDQKISIVTLPPSLLAVLPQDHLPALKTLVSAGEPCSWDIASRWANGRRFINGYGPTEITVAASYYLLKENKSAETKSVPIGRPVCNAKIYLLDRNLQPVPIGVPGELHVGGVGLARGYLNRPGLTAEKFIPDPFDPHSGGRLYKTGDLARYLADGNLEFLGRIDNQVKIRGFRIELGEIETVLKQYPGVRDAVCLARQDGADVGRLVAYLVVKEASAPATTALRSFLKNKLPGYMIPSAFVVLDAFPLNPNGKVDRRGLPAPDKVRPQMEASYAAPRSQAEKMLADVWAEVLHIEQVGINDNFFDLGGHSLLMSQVHRKLREIFSMDISMITLFQYPTIGSLSNYLGCDRPAQSSFQKIYERAARQEKAMIRQKQIRSTRRNVNE